MNVYYEILFWCVWVLVGLCIVCMSSIVALVLYERFVEGKVDVFKAERRAGPADRAGLPAR